MNFVAGDDFGGGAESGRDTAVFFVGQLDGVGDGLLREAAAVEDVADFNAAETARVFLAALAVHFDAVFCDRLAFLAEDTDDVRCSAAAEGDEQKFHGTGGAGALAVDIDGEGVAAGRGGDKEIVAGIADRGFGIFHPFYGKRARSTLKVHG